MKEEKTRVVRPWDGARPDGGIENVARQHFVVGLGASGTATPVDCSGVFVPLKSVAPNSPI
jgi:hypothetical protein